MTAQPTQCEGVIQLCMEWSGVCVCVCLYLISVNQAKTHAWPCDVKAVSCKGEAFYQAV